ncbi:hypothetical protein [Nocardia arthritidis]|uniref:DUF4254 domain-containing protein n=1 Tax=Nocardia arthritidis TaxID=228602 RepID=A0A6G9YL75_9NOCA|nr:hypothetical protein [Nocardia arthritidis]QIS13954.1 hypothetical protein F5544_30555 [Nocardia arthritidis]
MIGMLPDAYSLLAGSPMMAADSSEPKTSLTGILPRANVLLAALHRSWEVETDPELARWAYRLGVLYARLGDGPLPADIRQRASKIIDEVNDWIARTMPRAVGGATMAPVSMGELVAWIARAAKCSEQLPVSEIHPLWRRLAELVQAYNDLVRGLEAGTCDLPTYLPETDWS